MTSVATLLETPLVDLITGAIIRAGAGGVPAKMVARADTRLAINTALVAINNGDTTGVASLQTAINTSALDPSEALALQSLFAAVSTKIAALGTLASGTLLGEAETNILNTLLGVATTCATAYVTKYSPATVTSAPPTVAPIVTSSPA